MKKTAKIISALIPICLLLSSCGKIDEVSQKVIDDINSIGEVEPSDQSIIEKIESVYATLTDKQKEQVNNYATLLRAKDEIEEINKKRDMVIPTISTTQEIRNNIDTFLIECDLSGYGMKDDKSNIQILDITIENNIWNVPAVNISYFNIAENSGICWGLPGVGSKGDGYSGSQSLEGLLAVSLANLFPGIEDGSIKAVLVGGRTTSVAFSPYKNTSLEEGIDCPKINSDGTFDKSFQWSEIAGITKNGYVVGTAPSVGNYY